MCKSKKTELDQRGGLTVVQLGALEMEGRICDDPTLSLSDGEAPGRLRRYGNASDFLQIEALPPEGRRGEALETQEVPETNQISRSFSQGMEAVRYYLERRLSD